MTRGGGGGVDGSMGLMEWFRGMDGMVEQSTRGVWTPDR